MENGLLQTTEEFIVENKNHSQKVNSQRRKGGPYSKQQRDKRREEVIQNKFGELTPEQKQRLEIIRKNTDLLVKAVFDMLEKSQKRK